MQDSSISIDKLSIEKLFTYLCFVPADDLTDPAPVVIFGHLDAITVLSFISSTNVGRNYNGPKVANFLVV